MLWHYALAKVLPLPSTGHYLRPATVGRPVTTCRVVVRGPVTLRRQGPEDAEELVTIIRPFCNADLPALLELWIQHWSLLGPPPRINAAKLEQAILARTFFDPASILLAATDDLVQAWCHYGADPTSEKTAVICAFCLAPACGTSVSQQLLEEAQQRIAKAGFERVRVGLVRDDQQGYAGLDPIGHGIAVPVLDARTTALLQQNDYSAERSVTRMTASTDSYRPPVSRESLQFRRTSQVRSDSFIDHDARRASGMSHLDIEVLRLVDRQQRELASVKIWLSDAEAEVMSPSIVILDIADAHQRGQLEPAEKYLVGTLVQSLAERSIDTVETVVDSDKSGLVAQLLALQFQTADEGICWAKSLS